MLRRECCLNLVLVEAMLMEFNSKHGRNVDAWKVKSADDLFDVQRWRGSPMVSRMSCQLPGT
jgi:hypothetical protein